MSSESEVEDEGTQCGAPGDRVSGSHLKTHHLTEVCDYGELATDTQEEYNQR
jgi:hypothetical protein